MLSLFSAFIDSYLLTSVGISEGFITPALSLHLISHVLALHSTKQLLSAGTGNERIALQDKTYRSDLIYWLDRKHNNEYENAFLDMVDQFVLYLNSTCYTGITGYEFHYAFYEPGAFYKQHVDQFRNDDSRQYSFILYLNDHWATRDGGELYIHHPDHFQTITPTNGKCVFFRSRELTHEVLLTLKPRLSITGWLKVGAAKQ